MQADTETLLTHLALGKLLRAYARGVDRLDADLLRQVFHPKAEVITGVVDCDGASFPDRITDFIRSNVLRNSHAVVSEWFEVNGDTAVGESYVIATSTTTDAQTLVGGRYLNNFVREDGRWWISRHLFVLDYTGDIPQPPGQTEMFAVMQHLGRFGREDPVYAHWDKR